MELKQRELEQFEIDKKLQAGVIEYSSSEWASPIMFDRNKDGRLRFWVYYRRLNKMTVKECYPILRMDEAIDSLGDAKVFTTLDAY